MATGVKEGQQYVVDGAIFRCQYGSAPCQIMAISNQKVTAQNKPVVTDKDVTFMIPSAPFVTCSKNTQVPPTCVYANGIWKTKTTVQHGDQNVIVEKSVMKCPVYQGKIECIFPGQVQSVSAPELAEFKIETLSNFPLALVVTPPAKNQEEKEKKASGVLSVSASKYKVRSDEVITLHALDNDKKELKPTDIVNWAVTTRKKTEEKVKSKTVSKECIDKLTLIKKVSTPFNISFHEPGIYYIEGGSDKIASKYSELKTDQPLIGDKYPPFDENCKAVVEVLCGNSITGIKKVGDKKAISDTVYVKQGGSAVFTPEFKLDYNPDFELLKCSVTKKNGESVLEEDYKYDEGGHSLTLTPSSAEVDYRITFSLYKKTDETIEETPMSEKSILVHSYNEAVLYAYIPGATKGSANGNTTLRRPGDTLIFTVKQKDGKAEDLDKIVWNVKKDGKLFEKDIKGEMILYKFKEEGVYTIEADLKGTLLSNGGVKENILTDFDEESANPENKNVVVLDELNKSLVNEEGKGDSGKSVNGENHKERIITHKLKISRNEVTGVRLGATNGKRYVGVRYTIEPSFLFGDATYRDERNNVVYTCEGADADCLKRGIFLATKPGDYIVKATLNGKECKSQPFTIQDATFSKWEFCDSEKKKISYIGRNMTFGINASVPAWAQNSGDEKKNNKEITVSIFCKNKAIQTFKTKLDEAGSFHIDNIDVEKDIIANAKNIVSFDGIQDLIINFVVNDSPSKIVKGLSISKVGHGLFSTKANLTVKSKPFIDGYFADKNGKKLVKIVNYVDGSSNNKVTARLNVLNYSKENLKDLMFCLYENKWGIDPIVFKSEDFNLNESGVVEISIPLNEGNIKEKDHGDSKLPRLFYFKVFERKISYSLIDGRSTSTWQKVCAYPKSPGDLYNYNVQAEMSTVQDEALKDLSENVAGKDYNSDKLNTVRSYYYQLKISKQSEESKKYVNSYNSLAPVVVGEDWEKEETKAESGCKCPRCREAAEDMEMRLMKIFPNTNVAKEIAEAYCEFQYKLRMDSCWIKAAFFSNGVIESNIGRDGIPKTEGGSYTRERLEDIKPSKIFKGKWKNGKWVSDTNKKGERIYKSDSIKAQLDDIFKKTGKEKEKAIFSFMYAGENGNGNYESGDGWKYRGGSYTQITHKNAYSKVKKILESVGYENVGELNADSFEGNIRLAVAASMAFFKYKHGNMHALCDGVIKHDDINFDAPDSYEDVKLIEKAFNVVGNDVKYESSFTDSKGGKVSFKMNHQGKMLFFKDVAYDAFQLKDCECNKVDVGDSGMITFHIYSNGRIEKHYPDDITDDKHYRYVYHPDSGEGYEVAVRKIYKNVPNFVSCEKIKDENLSKEIKGAVEISGYYKPGVDGEQIYAHYDKNNEIDYVVCDGHLDKEDKAEARRIYKYKTDKKKIEIVRMDEEDESKGEHDQVGLLYFYLPGKVFIYYRIIMDKTQRYYADAIQFAAFIGILAHYGHSKLNSIPENFTPYTIKTKTEIDKKTNKSITKEVRIPNDEYGRTGMGNTDIMGIGYPSVSHRQGMAFDYSYGTKADDKILIEGAKMFGFRKRNLNCGYKKEHIREGCLSIPGHETHIHMGPMNDSLATLEEAYEDIMDSHGKSEIYREVNKKA